MKHCVFRFVANEHTVKHDDMQMNIEVKAAPEAPEALHKGDGAGLAGT